MNEVTRIHLGRQPFTVSVEAHQKLKAYLAAIEKEVKDKSVAEEVELRMAELLTERGIKGDKVILESDVDFLKEQLGNPNDFTEDEAAPAASEAATKRLFRDTEHGWLGGVAAGLSNYFGVDVLLVRIAFAIAIITGGWGVLLYIAMWILVPEAKTSSDRLQMQGKPVTVEGLKEAVERADVKGAVSQVSSKVTDVINKLFRAILKLTGLGFILGGLAVIFGLITGRTYMGLHGGRLTQENIFPVTTSEHVLVNILLVMAALASVFIILFGLAIFRRKWPIKGWITGVLIGILFLGIGVSSALAADAYPRVRDRYNASIHTTTRTLQPFTKLDLRSGPYGVDFQESSTYSIELRYFGDPDLAPIKTEVVDGTLHIDTGTFSRNRHCEMVCLFPTYDLHMTIKAPNAENIKYDDGSGAVDLPLFVVPHTN